MKFFLKKLGIITICADWHLCWKPLEEKCWQEEKGGPSISWVIRLLWESSHHPSHSPGNLLWVIFPVWEMRLPWSHPCPLAWLLGDQWSALVVRQMGMHFMGISLWVVRLPTDSPVRMPVWVNLESPHQQHCPVKGRFPRRHGWGTHWAGDKVVGRSGQGHLGWESTRVAPALWVIPSLPKVLGRKRFRIKADPYYRLS